MPPLRARADQLHGNPQAGDGSGQVDHHVLHAAVSGEGQEDRDPLGGIHGDEVLGRVEKGRGQDVGSLPVRQGSHNTLHGSGRGQGE